MKDMKYWVWLSSIPGIGARRFNQLIDQFGSPQAIWSASKRQLEMIPGIGGKTVSNILDKRYRDNLSTYMNRLKELGVGISCITDNNYPASLKIIHDPPFLLYVRGTLQDHGRKAIAIVGSRKATEYGKNMAYGLAYELACRGIIIVSGMARGIDTQAHKGALDAGGRTIAVLGCGVDICYPPENRDLMNKIINSGTVISEFPLGAVPIPGNFPARNRIISGLSMGVVVIEAGEKSGSLITVDFALEQGKDVFAVPGNAINQESKGTNRLIKEGAKMVTCIEDILEEFGETVQLSAVKTGFRVEHDLNLDDHEKHIVRNIGTEPTHIDTIMKKTGYNIQKVNSIITMLELKGILKQLPGKFFIRA